MLSFVCQNLGEVAKYAVVHDRAAPILKRCRSWCFILESDAEVRGCAGPRRAWSRSRSRGRARAHRRLGCRYRRRDLRSLAPIRAIAEINWRFRAGRSSMPAKASRPTLRGPAETPEDRHGSEPFRPLADRRPFAEPIRRAEDPDSAHRRGQLQRLPLHRLRCGVPRRCFHRGRQRYIDPSSASTAVRACPVPRRNRRGPDDWRWIKAGAGRCQS